MALKLVSHILHFNTVTEKLSACASALDDLEHIYSDKFLTDVKLVTKTNSFPAHKIVLCARSPVFKLMFSNDMREANSSSIQVDDLEDYTVQQLLLFLYSDKIKDLQWDTASALYYAADKYNIEKLKLICSSFLIDNLSSSTVTELLVLADTHSDSDLLRIVENFILDHEEIVFCSDQWEKLMDTNPQLALKAMNFKYKIKKEEMDILKRCVQGVLNELTPQKFETQLSRLKDFNIDTADKLALVVDLIYEKSIKEPNSIVLCANLCKHLSLINVPVSGTSGTRVNFRKLLLNKCQKEFEQDRSDELKKEEKVKTLEAADPDKREELQLEYEVMEKIFRNKQLGKIRFIGEIFKLGMLIEPIIHECIEKFLSQGDEESLECLCQILKTVGKELDGTKMDVYMAQMRLIIDKRLTSSRLRIMLQDVIDLQKNNWVPNKLDGGKQQVDRQKIMGR